MSLMGYSSPEHIRKTREALELLQWLPNQEIAAGFKRFYVQNGFLTCEHINYINKHTGNDG